MPIASLPSSTVLLLPMLALGACVAVDDPADAELASLRDGPGDVFPPPHAVPGRWTFEEPPCGVLPDPTGGIPEQLGIDPPIPPQPYGPRECSRPAALAGDCVTVQDAAELELYASSDPGKNLEIILEDGYYLGSELSEDGDPDTHEFLALGRAHRLWAKNPGKAILTFGISAGGSACNPSPALAAKLDGPEFHGLVFDITNSYYAFRGQQLAGSPTAALASWGHSRGMKVQDCWFRGWDAVDQGISVSRPDGLVIERVEVLNFERFGVRVDLGWPEPSDTCTPASPPVVANDPPYLSDLAVHGIGDPDWASQGQHANCVTDDPVPLGAYCPGTQEHGIWIGETATLERARLRDVAWGGVVMADPTERLEQIVLRDLDVDDLGSNTDGWGAAIGFERNVEGALLEQFCVGPDVRRGVHSEWSHEDPSIANEGLTIADGWTRSEYVGISLDNGTRHVSIDNVEIDDACLAAMYMSKNNNDQLDCCTTSTWSGVDITGVSATCEILIRSHPQPSVIPNGCGALEVDLDDCLAMNGSQACVDVGGVDECPP